MCEGYATPTEEWFEELLELMFRYLIEGSGYAAESALEMQNAPGVESVKTYKKADFEIFGRGIIVEFEDGSEFAIRVTQTKKAGE